MYTERLVGLADASCPNCHQFYDAERLPYVMACGCSACNECTVNISNCPICNETRTQRLGGHNVALHNILKTLEPRQFERRSEDRPSSIDDPIPPVPHIGNHYVPAQPPPPQQIIQHQAQLQPRAIAPIAPRSIPSTSQAPAEPSAPVPEGEQEFPVNARGHIIVCQYPWHGYYDFNKSRVDAIVKRYGIMLNIEKLEKHYELQLKGTPDALCQARIDIATACEESQEGDERPWIQYITYYSKKRPIAVDPREPWWKLFDRPVQSA